MGLDYAFEFVAPRSGASGLLAALAGRIDGAYARALRAALPWSPQTPGRGDAGIRGLRQVFDISNYYDVVVMTGIDAEVQRYFKIRTGGSRITQSGARRGSGWCI